MIDLVIVGTIGLDDIETPFGKVRSALGGSAAYAAFAASFFKSPGLISIVGQDFPKKELEILSQRKIDLKGLSKGEKTFRWSGFYEYDMNEAKTLKTELNAFLNFSPEVPGLYQDARYLFLANIDPLLQLKTLSQIKNNSFVLIDTMNYWIEHKKRELIEVIKRANLVLLNDGEARQLFQTPNLIKAARQALELGPEYVIIKKGEHGALLFSHHNHFSAPAYPLEELRDPTGSGDSFAGGLIGFLAKTGRIDEPIIRQAVIYGSAIASFCAEGFGLENLKNVKLKDIKERYEVFRKIREF